MAAIGFVVGAGNEAQAEAWGGNEGQQWAGRPEFYDRAIRRHHARLMAAAAIGERDRVLDIGCGNGLTTRDAARAAVEGHAVGVDLSGPMLERALQLAQSEGITNVTFLHADAQVHPFDAETFDVVISRFGSMFFADGAGAFENIGRAMRPEARLVLLSWQGPQENEWISEFRSALALGRSLPTPPPGAPGPFGHADRDQTARLLSSAGFGEVSFESVEEPTYFGANATEAFEVLGAQLAWMVKDLEGPDREAAFDNLRRTLADHETPDGPRFGSKAWLVSARRR